MLIHSRHSVNTFIHSVMIEHWKLCEYEYMGSDSMKSDAQSCPTLCNPMNYTVHGILQAKILEWVAFPFSRGSSQPRDQSQVSRTAGRFFTSWATREAQEHWSGWPIPSPGHLPDPGIQPGLLHCRRTLHQLSHQERKFLFHSLLFKLFLSCVTSL